MNKFRFYVALWMAKLALFTMGILKYKGTNFPGQLAIKICPEFLRYIGKPERIIGITGTNGKTTVANMVIDSLREDGIYPLNNSYGSNIHTGIATALLKDTGFWGKSKKEMAILEIDERAMPLIMPYIKPEIMAVTNLFRDSMKRNAHTEYIAGILDKYIPDDAYMILNGDDIISSGLKPDNDRVYFGIESLPTDLDHSINLINDARICPECSHRLSYTNVRYHHIGRCYCSNCGFRSPEPDFLGETPDVDSKRITISHKGIEYEFSLNNGGIHNMYNTVCVATILYKIGYSLKEAADLMKNVSVVGSRFSSEKCGQVTVSNQMAKENNAVGSSRAFDYISSLPGDKELILMMNCLGDQEHWSENTCWLYDCDFELLNKDDIKHIIVTGPRGKDYHLRLLMAGVPEEKITWVEKEIDAPNMLSYTPSESIFIFFGTDSLVLGNKVMEKTKEIARKKGELQ